jgi:hypothetical protein
MSGGFITLQTNEVTLRISDDPFRFTVFAVPGAVMKQQMSGGNDPLRRTNAPTGEMFSLYADHLGTIQEQRQKKEQYFFHNDNTF